MSSTVVIVWVALLAAMFFFQFVPMIFASSQQCAVHVNPTRDQRTNTNCSEVQCSWNEALNWCSHNRSDALEWLLVLEPGIFSSVPLTLRTPIGVISLYIKSSPTGMAIWTGETARLIISNSSTLEDIYISQLEFRNSASMKVYVPDHANLTIDRCIFSNSVYSRPLSVFSGVNSSVSIDNSLIKNNTVAGGAAIEGNPFQVVIKSSYFYNNTIENGDSGAGVLVNSSSSSSIRVESSLFFGNRISPPTFQIPCGIKSFENLYGQTYLVSLCTPIEDGCYMKLIYGKSFSRCLGSTSPKLVPGDNGYNAVTSFSPSFQIHSRIEFICSSETDSFPQYANSNKTNFFFIWNVRCPSTLNNRLFGGGGLGVYTKGQILVQSSSFVKNSVSNVLSFNGSSGGGGMWIHGKSISVTGSYFEGNTVFGNGKIGTESNGGGAAWMYAEGDIAAKNTIGMKNFAAKNGIAGDFNGGGCFWMNSSGSVSIQQGYFYANEASQNGEGVFEMSHVVEGGSMNGGGAVWMYSSSSANITNCTMLYNKANENGQGGSNNGAGDGNGGSYNGGGALWMQSFANTLISHCTMVYNTANENGQGGSNNGAGDGNGGSYNGGGALWMYTNHTLSAVIHSVLGYNAANKNGQGGSSNGASSITSGDGNGRGGSHNGGGAMWIFSSFSIIVTSNCTMAYNIANKNGQGGSNNGGFIIVRNNGNGNGGSYNGGGAAWMSSYSGNIIVSDCRISTNIAMRNGQGGCDNESNNEDGGGNDGGNGDGGSENGGGAFWMYSSKSSVLVSSCSMEKNIATRNGQGGSNNRNRSDGGSKNGGGAAWMSFSSGNIIVSNCRMSYNTASYNGRGGSRNHGGNGNGGNSNGGGAILIRSLFFVLVSNCRWSDNIASQNGQGGLMNLNGDGNGGSLNGGGAIWMFSIASMAIQNCFMSRNIASRNGEGGSNNINGNANGGKNNGGGAVLLFSSSSVTLSNNTMFNNIADSNGQGGSHNLDGIANGGSDNGGGAVWIFSSFRAIIYNCTVTNNTAESNGQGGSINLDSNGGDNNGGGAMWLTTNMTASYGRTISPILYLEEHNKYVGIPQLSTIFVTMTFCTMTNNLAIDNGEGGLDSSNGNGGSHNGGGAVRIQSFSSTVSECVVANNTAINNGNGRSGRGNGDGGNYNGGGAMWIQSSFSTLFNCSMISNIARSNGQGGSSNLNGNGGSWNGGGVVWMYTFTSSKVFSCLIMDNLAIKNGQGGFSIFGNGNGGDDNGGGALWMYSSLSNIFKCKFNNNIAIYNGRGGSYILGNGNGGDFNGGGAVWIYSAVSSVTFSQCMLTNCIASNNGQGGSMNFNGNGGKNNGGGAVWMYSTFTAAIVVNCELMKNFANSNGQGGSNNQNDGNGGDDNGGGAMRIRGQLSSELLSCKMFYNVANNNGQGGSNNQNDGNGGSQNGGGAVWVSSYAMANLQLLRMEFNQATTNGNGGRSNGIQSIGGNSNGGGALFLWSGAVANATSRDNIFISNSGSQNGLGGTGSSVSSFSPGGSLCGGGAALLIGASLSHSFFFNNTDHKSGVVFATDSIGTDGSNNGGGAVLAQNSILSYCMFDSNAVIAPPLSSSGDGGAVRLVSRSKIEHSIFFNNLASFRGGGVASGSGTNSINFSTFSDNQAVFDGGAVVVDVGNVQLDIQFSRFFANQAQSRGGALAVVAFLASITSQNCIFNSNRAESQGGAAAVVIEGGKYISIQDLYFFNHAETFGGVLYSSSESFPSSGNDSNVSPALVSISNALFTNNTAGFGGVIMTDSRGKASIKASKAVSNHASTISGGFAHLAVRSNLNISCSVLLGNSATVSGGSIYQEHFSTLRIENVTISLSKAPSAAVLKSIHNTQAIVLNNSVFSNNHATLLESGAIFANGNASITVSDSRFEKNSAMTYAGVLAMFDTSRAILYSTDLVGNTARTLGGGAFYMSSSSSLTMENSSCSFNIAKRAAGGCGLIGDSASFIARNSMFKMNRAEQGDGGGLSLDSTKSFMMIFSKFWANQAIRGGALSFNASSVWETKDPKEWIRDSIFLDNRAVGTIDVPSVRSQGIGTLGPGGGGALFFNLPQSGSLSNAFEVWETWRFSNTFAHNQAEYGSNVSSVGLSPIAQLSSSNLSTSCSNVQRIRKSTQFSVSDPSVSMPGLTISLQLQICDAFGQRITTLDGGSIFFSLTINSSASTPLDNVIRTSFNGTGDSSAKLPIAKSGTYRLLTNVEQMPTFSLLWTLSPCVRFYGYDSSIGCLLCSPSEYSIDTSFETCSSCQSLSLGSACMSMNPSQLRNIGIIGNLFQHVSVTVVEIKNGYWPALYRNQLQSSVVAIACPFDFCFRTTSLYVTGTYVSRDLVQTSPSSACREGSNRDSESILCGRCLSGYVDWNYECYHCPNGIQIGYIFLFIFFMFGWTLVQLFLAQQGGSGSVTAMLFFLTQSLTWFTYPRGVLHTIENLVNFRFHVSTSNECYIDVDGSIEIFLRAVVPFLYFATLWFLYGIHVSLAWCCSRKDCTSIHASKQLTPFQKITVYLQNFLISTATTDPYQRTTALLLLSTFPSILDAVFSVWTCLDIPTGFNILTVVALTPTVECYTLSWWMWNIFYIFVIILLLCTISYVVYATTKARDEKMNVSFTQPRSSFVSKTEDNQSYTPFSLSEKFGVLWREAFRDQIPWWTAVELFIRFSLIGIFYLSVTRIPVFTNFILGIAILGWIALHNYYSPFRDKDIDRMVVVSQYAMLIMAMIASTTHVESETSIIVIFCVYGSAAGILGIHISWKLIAAFRQFTFSFRKRIPSKRVSEISHSLLEPALGLWIKNWKRLETRIEKEVRNLRCEDNKFSFRNSSSVFASWFPPE